MGQHPSCEVGDRSRRSHERQAIPAGNVFGGRNLWRLTGLSKWNRIRQAKTVRTLVFRYPDTSVVPVFIRSLALVAIRADSGAGLTRSEKRRVGKEGIFSGSPLH